VALQTPQFYLAGSKRARKSGFLRSIDRKNPPVEQALKARRKRAGCPVPTGLARQGFTGPVFLWYYFLARAFSGGSFEKRIYIPLKKQHNVFLKNRIFATFRRENARSVHKVTGFMNKHYLRKSEVYHGYFDAKLRFVLREVSGLRLGRQGHSGRRRGRKSYHRRQFYQPQAQGQRRNHD
jgi:hypothetical protein